jgi:uncharacterized protein YtpQ (UPF0354 family)
VRARSELEIAETLEHLRRNGLSRDSVFLLVAKLLELRNPGKRIVFSEEDAIDVIALDGAKQQFFLHNLWTECERSPEERVEIVERYIGLLDGDDEEFIRENVVAIVRDLQFKTFVEQADIGAVTEHLAGDLWILYANDGAGSTTVLGREDIRNLGLSSEDLKLLGTTNVEKLMSDLETTSYGDWCLLSSENSAYLSSSLLLDYVWEHAATMVEGDLVVAVPARDCVFFTGLSSAEGLRKLREEVADVVANGDHVVSSTLLRRSEGRWKLLS